MDYVSAFAEELQGFELLLEAALDWHDNHGNTDCDEICMQALGIRERRLERTLEPTVTMKP